MLICVIYGKSFVPLISLIFADVNLNFLPKKLSA